MMPTDETLRRLTAELKRVADILEQGRAMGPVLTPRPGCDCPAQVTGCFAALCPRRIG